MTVTGTWLPSSPKTWVIPILRPMSPSLRAISLFGGGLDGPDLLHHWGRRRQSRRSKAWPQDDQHGPDTSRRGAASPNGEHREARGRSRPERTRLYVRIGDDRERSEATPVGLASELDLDVDAGGQVELHQRVHGLRRGIDNVEESLVGAHLELLARGLVDVWAPQHGPAVDDRRQQHRPRDAGARPAYRLHDLLDRPIKQLMIVGLQADADFLIGGQGRHALLRDLRDDAGPHRPPPLPDRKPQLLLHRHRRDQLDRHRHVVPRHHHLHPRRQRHHPRHVRRPEIKLRPVPVEKRRVPPPLLLRQHVYLRLAPLVLLDRPLLCPHLPPLHFLLVHPPQQTPHIVPRLPLVQQLPKHLHPRHHRLARLPKPHDLHLFPHLHHPPLHPPRHHRPPPRDRKDVLDRHQKRLVDRPHRRRNVAVHRLHQLPYALRRLTVLRLLHRPQRRPPDHRNLVPRKLVLLQQLPHLQLHQVQNLRVVHHVHLVHEHHQKRHVHLPRQQHVLPRLRHRPVVRRHHQNRPVHLRRPRDHVLDVVGVPRTVDVRVVPLRRLVLHVRHRNRDPPLPLLRRVVDRPKLPHRHPAELRVQHLRDRRRQRRLPVVDVPDRPNVHVRLRPLVLRLRHPSLPPVGDHAHDSRSGAHVRDRTGDLVLTKDALCRLSYMGERNPREPKTPGAGNGIRTRDPQLGRLALYH